MNDDLCTNGCPDDCDGPEDDWHVSEFDQLVASSQGVEA